MTKLRSITHLGMFLLATAVCGLSILIPAQTVSAQMVVAQAAATQGDYAAMMNAIQTSSSATFEGIRRQALEVAPSLPAAQGQSIEQALKAREDQLVTALKEQIALQVKDLPDTLQSLDVLRDLEDQYQAMSPELYRKSKAPLRNRRYQIALPIQDPYLTRIAQSVEGIIQGQTDITEIDRIVEEMKAVHPDLDNGYMRSQVRFWKTVASPN